MKRIVVLVGFVFICVYTYAQTKYWTLDECIAYAYRHNIDIKAKELSARQNEISVSEQRWNYAPTISASNSTSISNGRVLDPTTYDYVENEIVGGNSSSINANINLFNGFRNHHNVKRAKLDLQSALFSIEQIKNDIRLNVTAYFFEILYAEENIHIAKQIVTELETQIEKTEKKIEAKKATIADLLQIKSQLADANNDILMAKQAYDIARLNLCQLLEIEDYSSFCISASQQFNDENIDLYTSEATLFTSMHTQPEIKAAEINIAIAQQDLKIAKASYYPTISMTVGYGSSFSDARYKMFQNIDGTYKQEIYPFLEQYKDNANSYVSVSLNFPIFNRLTARKNVQRQKIAVQQAEYALQQTRKQVSKEITQALIDVKAAYAKYIGAIQAVDYANEATRQITLKYEIGVSSVTDYNAVIRAQHQAQSRLSQTKYEYLFKRKILEYYTISAETIK